MGNTHRRAKFSEAERRLIKNEMKFRKANEKVESELKKLEKMARAEGDHNIIPARDMVLQFLCECSDKKCNERITMTLGEYEELHKGRSHFILISGHETKKIEKVISRQGDYNVVDKFMVMSEAPSGA